MSRARNLEVKVHIFVNSFIRTLNDLKVAYKSPGIFQNANI